MYALWERTDASTGKTRENAKQLTIKQTRMPPICEKTHTITPAMCKKHRRMPGKIRRAHLLYGVLEPLRPYIVGTWRV